MRSLLSRLWENERNQNPLERALLVVLVSVTTTALLGTFAKTLTRVLVGGAARFLSAR